MSCADTAFCRRSIVHHRESGVKVTTPLLIPSFSSKGFMRSVEVTKNGKHTSKTDVSTVFDVAGEFVDEVCLVSAYDIHYGFLPCPTTWSWAPEITFLDSGGYETIPDTGYSAVYQTPFLPKEWRPEDLERVLSSWPAHMPAVFVSFDRPTERQPFARQVEDARRLFAAHPKHLCLFLLKPEAIDQPHLDLAVAAAIANIDDLRRFDLIGMTEKELGDTMLARMANIAKMRLALDSAGIIAPIHIFGALDPLTVCLYYISGAEIFDGLSWLRYGYQDGVATYTHNYGVLTHGLNTKDHMVRRKTMGENYHTLLRLKQQLLDFRTTGCYSKLEPHADLIRDACDSLRTQLNGRI